MVRSMPSLSSFNLVDLLLAALVLLGIWAGWRRGFVADVAELAVLIACALLALIGYAPLAAWLSQVGWLVDPWAAPVAFLAILLVSHAMLGALARLLLRALPPRVHLHAANRALGMVPGAANGLINAVLAAMVLLSLPFADAFTASAQKSRLAERLAAPADWVEAKLGPIFNPAVGRTMTRLTVEPDSKERVALPFTVKDPKPRPDLEAAMLVLVNQERSREGLKPLRADAETLEVSRDHSRDMFARSYFSHVTPDGLDPFDRIRRADLRFLLAGENLALARTLEMAHQGLMNSPGHRANILRPGFGRVGIGIVDGGRYGLMVTQTFRN
ncbi:conserved membrane hypothetical protein [Burkholderiales bacterium 8X]|nr:conserved membrane hypothetical protein [Burkholderiales bacterium 8X]